jgi:hypothetical protein
MGTYATANTSYNLFVLPVPFMICQKVLENFLRNTTILYGDYKLCERLHKLIGKKVIVTQKLNAHHFKKKLKTLVFARMSNSVNLIFVWLLLSYQSVYVIAHIICNRPAYSLV